jgi:hypothetical protein
MPRMMGAKNKVAALPGKERAFLQRFMTYFYRIRQDPSQLPTYERLLSYTHLKKEKQYEISKEQFDKYLQYQKDHPLGRFSCSNPLKNYQRDWKKFKQSYVFDERKDAKEDYESYLNAIENNEHKMSYERFQRWYMTKRCEYFAGKRTGGSTIPREVLQDFVGDLPTWKFKASVMFEMYVGWHAQDGRLAIGSLDEFLALIRGIDWVIFKTDKVPENSTLQVCGRTSKEVFKRTKFQEFLNGVGPGEHGLNELWERYQLFLGDFPGYTEPVFQERVRQTVSAWSSKGIPISIA